MAALGATSVAQVSILTRPEGRVQPSRSVVITLVAVFQSSPVPKDGCNAVAVHLDSNTKEVSILTRPEGRVQHLSEIEEVQLMDVSILTRPEGRVQRRTTAPNSTLQSNFPAPLPC